VELAAERGLPMLLGLHIDDHDKAHLVGHYAKAARAAGRDPNAVHHIAAVLAHVADDRRDAKRALEASLPGWLAAGLAAHVTVDGRPGPTRDPVGYARRLCALHPIGSPRQCIDRLEASAERTGIGHVIMLVEGIGDRDGTLDNITRLGLEVLPHL
jgi:alkanesulfonate monooxygenase SsuD/methylene tetrahydromethanopterin reductase-like flavin-dependent oxidoreductase (luciferase family)